MSEMPVGFSWPFLEEMSNWTLGLGIVTALFGGVILRNPLFSAAVLAGVLADVAIVRSTVHRGMRAEAAHTIAPGVAGLFVGVRLAIKALILVVAYFAGEAETFWGAVIGVVMFDTVLLLVGSIRAATTMFEAKER